MSTADLMAGTLDSGGDMYQLTLRLCFILLCTAFVCGCVYEIIRRKRRAAKVTPKDVPDVEPENGKENVPEGKPEDGPEGKISFLFLFYVFRLSSCWLKLLVGREWMAWVRHTLAHSWQVHMRDFIGD